ncbi:MAG: hypothetical protein ACMUJM_05760 [bacterium]
MNEYRKIPYNEIPDSIKAIINPESPLSQRSEVIKNIKVMPPGEAIMALYILMDDPEEEIKEEALNALSSLLDTVLKPALADQSVHPYIIDFFSIPNQELVKETPSAQNEGEKENLELWREVKNMTIGQKMVLAQNGNKEARSLLIRESNKMILRGLINNGRITASEVLMLANSRSVDENIIRTIASNREWMKDYKMQLAVIRNPKCPLETSRRLILLLHKNDLRDISKSKDLPSALVTIAKKLYGIKSKQH